MDMATSAMYGRSMNGLKGFWPASRSAPSAMLTAWSPIRSRSLLILSAAMRNRRSTATGCCSARREIAFDGDFHAVDLLVRGDDRTRLVPVDFDQRFDGPLDLALDLASHEDQVPPELLELF
jgi:hypothetical protein